MKTAPALAVLMLALAASLAPAAETPPAGATDIQAVTKPSQDVTLEFTHPGLIASILVKEGDTVTAGQIVAKQDDTEEQAALDVAQAQANDNTRGEAQVKVAAQKEKAYQNKKNSTAASQSEIDEALLDAEVGKANVRLSEFEHLQDARKAAQAKAALEKTRLKSPINGVVEQIILKAGESVDAQNMKVMRIVQIDPLWIEVPVPFSIGRDLKTDSPVSVMFSRETRSGKVIHVATVADAASQTLLVRVQVENTQKTPAGENVMVAFPAAPKAVAEK